MVETEWSLRIHLASKSRIHFVICIDIENVFVIEMFCNIDLETI